MCIKFLGGPGLFSGRVPGRTILARNEFSLGGIVVTIELVYRTRFCERLEEIIPGINRHEPRTKIISKRLNLIAVFLQP